MGKKVVVTFETAHSGCKAQPASGMENQPLSSAVTKAEVPVSAAELSGIRFPSGNSFIIGDAEVSFGHGIAMVNALMMLTSEIESGMENITILVTEISKVEGNVPDALSFEEAFTQATEYVVRTHAQTWGETLKSIPVSIPLLCVAYELEDRLCFAVQDAGHDDPEMVFDLFTRSYVWWLPIMGWDKTMEMLRAFFDRILPLITG